MGEIETASKKTEKSRETPEEKKHPETKPEIKQKTKN